MEIKTVVNRRHLAMSYKRTNEPFAIDNSGKTVAIKYQLQRRIALVGAGAIEYVVKGKGTVTENNNTFQVKAGDIFILHQEQYHDYCHDPDDPWIKLWLQVSGPAVPDLFRAYGIANVNHIPDIDLLPDFLEIQKIINKNTDQETIDREGPILLLRLVKKIRDELQKREESAAKTPARKIREMIDNLPNGNITLEQISEEFHFSKRHLARIFKEEYNISIYDYILNRKIAIAQSLLKKTSLSVSEIADQLHFCTATYFTEFFRKHTGLTPLQFRKKYKS